MADNEQLFLTTGEFTRAMDRQTTVILTGFGRIDLKIDNHGDRLASLEERIGARESAVKKTARINASGWGAFVSGAVITLIEIVKHFVR